MVKKEIPIWLRLLVLLVMIPFTIAMLHVVLDYYIPRFATKFTVLIILIVCLLLFRLLRNKKKQRTESLDQTTEKTLSSGIMFFFSLIGATGTVFACLICYDPQQSDPIIKWLFRIAGGCIASVGLVFTIFCVYQFFAAYKRPKYNGNELGKR